MDPSFKARDYQVEDLSRLMMQRKCGLFHDPGTGKTFIMAMYAQYLVRYANEKVVITQPGGIIKKNYRDILFSTDLAPEEVQIVQGTMAEREEQMRSPTAQVFLISAQGWANEWEKMQAYQPKIRHSFHDECHLAFTTHGSARSQNWYRASRRMESIVPSTGTIIRGRLDSAYPVLHLLAPMYYGSDRAFNLHHGWYDGNGKVIAWKNHDRLAAVLQKVGIFRSFKSVYGEEAKVIQVEKVEMSEGQARIYKTLEATALIELEDSWVDAGNPAVAAMRARQILACPEMFEVKGKTPKDEALEVHIADHIKSGERLVIFSALTHEQTRIAKLITMLGGTVGHINGTVSNVQRQTIDANFCAGAIQFVVASPATAGIGYNWAFLKTVIFASVDYTDDSFIQAYRRGIRGVRSEAMLILILKYEGTVEDRILEIIDRKSMDHHLVSDGIEPLNLHLL
jgi:hypothetical protein